MMGGAGVRIHVIVLRSTFLTGEHVGLLVQRVAAQDGCLPVVLMRKRNAGV